jgi:hypothetical protein
MICGVPYKWNTLTPIMQRLDTGGNKFLGLVRFMITRSFVYTISESNGRGVVAISNQVQALNFKGSLEDAIRPSPLVTYPPNPNTHCNHSIRSPLSNLIMKCVCLSKINTSIRITTSHVVTLIAIIGFYFICMFHKYAIIKAHKEM